MSHDVSTSIRILGAAEHNLKHIDVEIPKGKLVVLTGVSGSGKSSLAFDTLYAEGQRRYVESLSAYARQFLGQLDKPAYTAIRGLTPTIAIEQKTASRNPRSTVGTITEITDYLRVLYARVGEPHCPDCGRPVTAQSAEDIARRITELPPLTSLLLLAPRIVHRKGEHQAVLNELREEGLVRARIDGQVQRLDEGEIALDKKRKHSIEAVVDRIVVRPEWAGAAELPARLADSVETALRLGSGELIIQFVDERGGAGQETRHSETLSCPHCRRGLRAFSPQSFSFNSPLGMCPACTGLGHRLRVDETKLVPRPELSLHEGCIAIWKNGLLRRRGWLYQNIRTVGQHYGIDLDTPFQRLSETHRRLLLDGSGDEQLAFTWRGRRSRFSYRTRFRGAIAAVLENYQEKRSEKSRAHYRPYLIDAACPDCRGERLGPESRAVTLGGLSLHRLGELPVREALRFFRELALEGGRAAIAAPLRKEIEARLGFLANVGLEYLNLNRSGPTLSGGEAQRIRLASQVGSELTGVTYCLDEPSIGLHPRDHDRLLATLEHLRDIGNTVVVVEHDAQTMLRADHLLDFGPGAGVLGGRLVYAGPPEGISQAADSLTGAYLSGRMSIPIPAARRAARGYLGLRGARLHNVQDLDADLPLGLLTCVTGVSGAGKSSLVNGILLPALETKLAGDADDEVSEAPRGALRELKGADQIDKVIIIDQRPIGRTPRSNPATYTKLFDAVRDLFAELKASQAAGYHKGRFSFNVKGGRCEACGGDGLKRIEMHFLADVFIKCEACQGRRFNEQTLKVRYRGLNIAQVLDLSVHEALELFAAQTRIARTLQTLVDVGLDYIALGQSATTLSGGEAQRIKLSRELAKRQTGRTLYVLDEPTTGLHFEDVRKLLAVLQRLVDAGNTVIVIEHNLDIMAAADHIIDLGPEGGDAGGRLVAQGTPEVVATVEHSHTGRLLRAYLERRRVTLPLLRPRTPARSARSAPPAPSWAPAGPQAPPPPS